MGDDDDGGVQLLLKLPHEAEDLRLNGHVERSGRFVGNENRGVARESHGDHDALPHPTGKLMGVLVEPLVGFGNTYALQHGMGAFTSFCARQPLVQDDGFHNLVADGEDRVEAGERLLEDHGDVVAAHVPHG